MDTSSPAKQTLDCRYRDGARNRGKGCLLTFEVNSGQGGSNRKYCSVCQKLANKDRQLAYRAREHEKWAKLPEESRGFKIRACKGWRFGLERKFPAEMAKRKGGRKALAPLPCLDSFKPTNGQQIFCSNCALTRLRARQGAAATAAYHRDAKRRGGPGAARHKKRLAWGRKSAANYQQRHREEVAALRIQVEAGKDAAAMLKKIEEGKAPVLIGAGRMVMKKPGPIPDILRGAMICRLRRQGFVWKVVRKRVEAHFNIHTTLDALKKLEKRHLAREKKGTN